MPRYLKKRKRGYYLALPVPSAVRHHFGGKAMLEDTLGTRDERLAEIKAQQLASEYRLRFLALQGNGEAAKSLPRDEYQRAFAQVQAGEIMAYAANEDDPVALGVELAIDAIVDPAPVELDRFGEPEPILSPLQQARVAGLVDGLAQREGKDVRFRRHYELPFKAVADKWLDQWKAAPDRKPTNTGSQYGSAIRLFHEYWGDRPLREVTEKDAAEWVELLKQLPSTHGRGKLVGMPLKELVRLHGEPGKGLKAPTIKRHLLVLKQIWGWAKPLGYCTGDHPFTAKLGKHRTRPYLGWETQDLQALFTAPPLRRDIYEAFYIAMFTGLRIGEVADMTWGQVRTEQGIPYLQVQDAKTEAGYRKVPLHSKLKWLLKKPKGHEGDPIFPTFNPEGEAKSRGGDASKLFGEWKRRRGINSDRYVFHSARKNTTRIMEENGVPQSAWARVIGHEPGFTYGTYNDKALSLGKAKDVIELIEYPEVSMRSPVEVYGELPKLRKAA